MEEKITLQDTIKLMTTEALLDYFSLDDESLRELETFANEKKLDWNIYLNQIYRESRMINCNLS
jgi:hypothetical protein